MRSRRPLAGEGAHSVTVGKLKERLFFGTPHSFVLRRDKSELGACLPSMITSWNALFREATGVAH